MIRESRSAAESALIWKGRKSAFGAMGQIADYICLDGTIPVGELPFVLRRIGELTAGYGLGVANVFHAGDGNMHPLILYDANKPGDLEKAEALGVDILRLCVEVGGCLTGEHGVGVEKRDLMGVQYAPDDLEAQLRVKDVFDPHWLLNPAKVFPLETTDGRRAGMSAAPATEDELADVVRAAAAAGRPLAIEGGGTRGIGHAVEGDRLSTAALTGITLYEPGALTLVVRAGTPLAEVEAALAAEGQMLPFEPWDARALTGSNGVPTVGGMVAVNAAGPRRMQAGACRDSLIGVRFVDGTGAVVKNGGRVMKNVTGLDLVKLMAGSHGTLGVLTEVGFKVLPRPEATATLVLEGLDDATARAGDAGGDGDAVRGVRGGAPAGAPDGRCCGWRASPGRWRTGRGRWRRRWPGSVRRRSRRARATGPRCATPPASAGAAARSGGCR